MNDNNTLRVKTFVKRRLAPAPETVQAEVDDLYNELVRRFGTGYADHIIRRYTDLKPNLKEDV